MLDREALVDELFQGIDTDLQVAGHVVRIDGEVALGGLDALGKHRLVAHQQERPRGRLIEKAGHEYRRRLHVDGHGADFLQVFFEQVVVLPDPPVGGVDGAGPIVSLVVADGCGNSLLQCERRQGGHFRRKIVVARAFAANGGDGQDQIADFGPVFDASAFAEEKHGLRLDRAEQVHDRGRGGAAHAEVDDRDASGGGAGHRAVLAAHRYAVPLRKKLNVVFEIREQDMVPEFIQWHARITRQPVFHDVMTRFHSGSLPGDGAKATEKQWISPSNPIGETQGLFPQEPIPRITLRHGWIAGACTIAKLPATK